jgi:hypothetical protein
MDSESKSNLTNLECEEALVDFYSIFTISEFEVWEVIYEN